MFTLVETEIISNTIALLITFNTIDDDFFTWNLVESERLLIGLNWL